MSKFLKIAALSLALILTSALVAQAGKPRLRYGLQWGYSAKVASAGQYTYRTSMGYRVSDDNPLYADYYTNAFVSADLGLEFLNWFALTARFGYKGIAKDYRVMPAELQLAVFPKGYENSGLFGFASGGMALYDLSLDDGATLFSAGVGLRRNLSRKISLDGFLKAGYTVCSPLPVDQYEGKIPRESVVYSRAQHISVDLGLALYF